MLPPAPSSPPFFSFPTLLFSFRLLLHLILSLYLQFLHTFSPLFVPVPLDCPELFPLPGRPDYLTPQTKPRPSTNHGVRFLFFSHRPSSRSGLFSKDRNRNVPFSKFVPPFSLFLGSSPHKFPCKVCFRCVHILPPFFQRTGFLPFFIFPPAPDMITVSFPVNPPGSANAGVFNRFPLRLT